MAKFKVVVTELTTYVHYVEAENDDQAIDMIIDNAFAGEEIAHDFQVESTEEV